LVTGAAVGIGRAISRRLARDGIAIGVLDLKLEDAQQVAEEIAAAGGTAMALQADIAVRTSVQAAVKTLRDAFGPVVILVNNAGITGFTPFLELTDAQWDRMMEINLKGTFIVTQTVIPDMLTTQWGRVVNISSSSAQSGAALMAHYSASKGGMIALTKTLAREFGPRGITVNTIPPRFVMNTAMSEWSFQQPAMAAQREQMRMAGPIQREGQPEDIAGACAWLVSDEDGYVTGQIIGVNGGRYI
jgi:2-hydroxycyclohexanecarboxyl-CoA dehydrogenase